jgi:hypothetical protein
MRAFSSGRISVSIALLVAVFILGTLVISQNAVAREPEVDMYTSGDGGGSTSGQEWKTSSSGDAGELPVDSDRTPGPGHEYTEGPQARAEDSWAERVEAWYIRLLKAISAVLAQRYF